MVLDLSIGSTAAFVVSKLDELLKSDELKDIVGVPTSKLASWVDDADEVDPNLNLKGRRGTLLTDKKVEAVSETFVVGFLDGRGGEQLGFLGFWVGWGMGCFGL
ncbi:probable ribose-5-phosphate isomerase 3, chloroplastic [Pyrus x bretschneideri]|uniref:probable ribose-5-phosphate isomerase 3, chloroplastic n=1 Tax=Pyrus x bretschneideri TaxID=225117 RepID=UPI00202ED171|nr:probable ribose-5-phosphate isomerase 3, chloroplastic [Pyrus x bretschneideri]